MSAELPLCTAVESKRLVQGNTGVKDVPYAGNETRTSKYTVLTFLPKALFEQVSCPCLCS